MAKVKAKKSKQVVKATPAPIIDYRFSIPEAARALKISRALLYRRIAAKEITAQHDGTRCFISRAALENYIQRGDALALGAA